MTYCQAVVYPINSRLGFSTTWHRCGYQARYKAPDGTLVCGVHKRAALGLWGAKIVAPKQPYREPKVRGEALEARNPNDFVEVGA